MLDPIAALNAIAAGVLLGGFYAAVALGIGIAFGTLDIPSLSDPVYGVMGLFPTGQLNCHLSLDPVTAGMIMAPPLFLRGWMIYHFYYLYMANRSPAGAKCAADRTNGRLRFRIRRLTGAHR
jgi:branched-chain amino acid transport system permease protein